MSLTQSRADQNLIAWWALAGVDMIVTNAPTPWLRAMDAEPKQTEARRSSGAETVRSVPRTPICAPKPDARAESLACACDSPAALAAAAREFAGPEAMLFDGAVDSGLLFILDAPCPDDHTRLLDGREGALFDRMLTAIGRDRTRAGIATAAFRPGTVPAPAFLARLIALARPRALVALGGAATTILTGNAQGLNRLRGQWLQSADGTPTLPTFHPAHLLQHPAHKALAWADLLALTTKIDN